MKLNAKKIILISLIVLPLLYIAFSVFINYGINKFIEKESKEYTAENLSDSDTQLLGNEIDIDFSGSDEVKRVVYSNYKGLIAYVTVNNLSTFLEKNLSDSALEYSVTVSDVSRFLKSGDSQKFSISQTYREDNFEAPDGKIYKAAFRFVKSQLSDVTDVTVVYDEESDEFRAIIYREKISDKVFSLLSE